MLGWLFLIGALIGAWHTYNALRRVRSGRRIGPLWLPALLTNELIPLHLAWQAGLVAIFVAGGAADGWPGRLALALTAASWIGMFGLARRARLAYPAVEEALRDAFGADYRERIGEEARRWADAKPRVLSLWRVPKPPDGVKITRSVAYGSHRRQAADIYEPEGGSRGAPVILQIHGGSWMRGRRDSQARPLLYHLAQHGWVCVAISYRVSPEATFPDHLVDVKAAIAWIRRHGAAEGWDADFIAVTGGSAGGHLAAMAALTANDPQYQSGFEDEDTSVTACVPMYGIFDLLRRDGLTPLWPFLRSRVMKSSPATDLESWHRASPRHLVHAAAPPFFALHGGDDSLVRPGGTRRFIAALRAVSESPVVYAEIPGGNHGFEYFSSPRAAATVAGVARFLGFIYTERQEVDRRSRFRPEPAGE